MRKVTQIRGCARARERERDRERQRERDSRFTAYFFGSLDWNFKKKKKNRKRPLKELSAKKAGKRKINVEGEEGG